MTTMKPNSKSWRKAARRKSRRLRAADVRWATLFPARTVNHNNDAKVERYNRAVRRLNRNLRKPNGGYSLCDGWVECPVCNVRHLTFGDPDEWTRNDNPARLKRSYDVSGYWPGMAQCCGLLIAPEFEQRCIVVDEDAYAAAKSSNAEPCGGESASRPHR
jgi:hypothetical protein